MKLLLLNRKSLQNSLRTSLRGSMTKQSCNDFKIASCLAMTKMFSVSLFFKTILISLLIIICSCNAPYRTVKSDTDKYYPTSFISESTSLLYKAKIEAFGKYYSGLLFIKPQSDDTVRIIFMSEIGLKFFDFEINGSENKINYCFEPMNKDYIVNTLTNDFRLMLLKIIAKKVKSKQIADSDISLVKYLKPKKTICTFQKPDDRVIELKHKSSFSKSVRITYSDFINKIPEKINIIHRYIKLSIELNLIEKK